MSRKRTPIKFEELDSRGRGAILRSKEEIAAEEAALADQNAGMPEVQHAGDPASPPLDQPSASTSTRAEYQKVTYRISPEALDAIYEIKRILRRKYGLKAALEEIAEEAILAAYHDLGENQQTSILVNKFSGDPEN